MDFNELRKKAFEEEEAARIQSEGQAKKDAARNLKGREDVTITQLRDKLGIVVEREDLKNGVWICGNLKFSGYENYAGGYADRALYGSPAWIEDLEEPDDYERLKEVVKNRRIHYWTDVFQLMKETDSLDSLRLSDHLLPEAEEPKPKPEPKYAYFTLADLNKHADDRNFIICGNPFYDGASENYLVLVHFVKDLGFLNIAAEAQQQQAADSK